MAVQFDTVSVIPARPLTAYKVAWCIALVFYFLEYVGRSAPAVMIPELTAAFDVSVVKLSAIIGSYYYTYAVASLLAGASLDRYGASAPIAIGATVLGVGCLLFAIPVPSIAESGRLLQGLGSAFAFTGAVFLASRGFSGRSLATAVGCTQCVGMLGGSAGQVAVGPLIHGLTDWRGFWIATAFTCLLTAATLRIVTPRKEQTTREAGARGVVAGLKAVFGNPQSYFCGLVAGLLFTPTTVGTMIWGVAIFQHDRGLLYNQAITTAALVPLGWAIGCPLLGWLADLLGRRKPVLFAGQAVMLLAILLVASSNSLAVDYAAMLALGVGSGVAMIPYTMIKEVNPDRFKGSATGVMNFLTFTVTAVVGPIFAHLFGASLASSSDHAAHFRGASLFWIAVIVLAIVVSLVLRETGAARSASRMKPKLNPG